uniref:inverse autotransporter beta domain-containing protein n=1 Tax=Salmonella enterica TaxID=28901 RepID=UPI000ACF5060
GGIGGEGYKKSLAFFGNYFFPLTGWEKSAGHELNYERPGYGFYLRTKRKLPDFSWFSGGLTNEKDYGGKVGLFGVSLLHI